MHDPHLVASAAGGDVEALLEQFLVPERERAARVKGQPVADSEAAVWVSERRRGPAAGRSGRTFGPDFVKRACGPV